MCSGGTVSLQLHMTVIMLHLPVDLQVLTLQGEKRGGRGEGLGGVRCLRVPQRGQHSPSGTVALAQGISGQEILRHTVAESCKRTDL